MDKCKNCEHEIRNLRIIPFPKKHWKHINKVWFNFFGWEIGSINKICNCGCNKPEPLKEETKHELVQVCRRSKSKKRKTL